MNIVTYKDTTRSKNTLQVQEHAQQSSRMHDYNSSEYSLNRESMIFKTIQQKGGVD